MIHVKIVVAHPVNVLKSAAGVEVPRTGITAASAKGLNIGSTPYNILLILPQAPYDARKQRIEEENNQSNIEPYPTIIVIPRYNTIYTIKKPIN